jgi:hypothetical protein
VAMKKENAGHFSNRCLFALSRLSFAISTLQPLHLMAYRITEHHQVDVKHFIRKAIQSEREMKNFFAK